MVNNALLDTSVYTKDSHIDWSTSVFFYSWPHDQHHDNECMRKEKVAR